MTSEQDAVQPAPEETMAPGAEGTVQPAAEETAQSGSRRARTAPKTRQGVVLRDKMDKTVVVEVVRRFRHAKYGKFIKRRMRYKAHDPDNSARVGDTVLLAETRPLSKTKRWRVKEIVQRAVVL